MIEKIVEEEKNIYIYTLNILTSRLKTMHKRQEDVKF